MDPRIRQRAEETPMESQTRISARFPDVENALPRIGPTMEKSSIFDRITSLFGRSNPFAHPAVPEQNTVWLLDNTAYRPIHPYPHQPQPFQAEFVACFFKKTSRKDLGKFVASIADQIGLDGSVGSDEEVRRVIAQRLQPFVDQIAPARTLDISIPGPHGAHVAKLGPSNSQGISSQLIVTGDPPNLAPIHPTTVMSFHPPVYSTTHFALPTSSAWAVISDIDDTIKYTKTPSPIGILRTTFADTPVPIEGMPHLYQYINSHLAPNQSAEPVSWFYLSASPYNLYPFLRTFLQSHFPLGQMILRDNSWMDLGGLLKSFTQGVQAYKFNRLEKIHDWLPQRKFILIGDSTQSDTEAYAEIYEKYRGWIGAIFIRRVLDAGDLGDKNSNERFQKAFRNVPKDVWMVFEKPEEIYHHIDALARKGTNW